MGTTIVMNKQYLNELEPGWDIIMDGVKNMTKILIGLPEIQFSSNDHIMLRTTIIDLGQIIREKLILNHDYSDKYKKSFEGFISSMILPSLREKRDEFMLREFARRWMDYKIVVMPWLCRFFYGLNRYFMGRPLSVSEIGVACFRDLVYQELKGKIRDAVISIIEQEREGEEIDRALLRSVLNIFVDIGMEKMDHYENDFEEAMLKDSAAYYSRKASDWILEDSCPDYMLKAEECLKREKDRVSHYLHSSSEPKLLEKVRHVLLSVYEKQLLEKEHSGCHALLRDGKVDDLSRMFRLFHKIPQGLVPVSLIFKQHVTDEVTALVKHADDAASNEKADKKELVGLQKQVFVREVIELHNKCLAYIKDCFQNNTLFHEALSETFDIFCKKGVAGSSSAELLAAFAVNVLEKGGSEKLSDEAVEETLEKIVKLLGISDEYLFAESYRSKLSHRLLFDKSVNDEHEKSISIKAEAAIWRFLYLKDGEDGKLG